MWRMSSTGGLEKTLQEVVSRLLRRYRVHAVILFGSRARGDWGPWSDIDLLVIADFDKPYLDRLAELLDLVADISEPLEFHPYTLDEALTMLRKLNPLIIDALWEGKVLYSDEKFKILQEEFQKLLKRGLKRSNTTIYLENRNSKS